MILSFRRAFPLAVVLLCGVPALCAEEKPQYQFEKITVPAARADEPRRASLSVPLAMQYLEDGAKAWTGAKKCVSCHTNGTYMVVRPALTPKLGPPDAALRTAFVETLKKDRAAKPADLQRSTRPAQVIYTAAGLAEWDAHVGRKLSAETAQALELMFAVQQPNGTWGSLDCWPPYESDAYHLATVAAMAAATAPGWLDGVTDEKVRAGVQRLKGYLRTEKPPHDYSRVLLLWAAARMPGLIDAAKKQELVVLLEKHQRADGGWSMRTFASPEAWGKGNRAGKLRGEPEFKDPPSDGHMTGLAVIVLRESGTPADDARLRRAVQWLQQNQRESGRWWTRSLNTDTYHFITYSGTAFPVLALAMCDALPTGTAGR